MIFPHLKLYPSAIQTIRKSTPDVIQFVLSCPENERSLILNLLQKLDEVPIQQIISIAQNKTKYTVANIPVFDGNNNLFGTADFEMIDITRHVGNSSVSIFEFREQTRGKTYQMLPVSKRIYFFLDATLDTNKKSMKILVCTFDKEKATRSHLNLNDAIDAKIASTRKVADHHFKFHTMYYDNFSCICDL